MLFTNRDCTPDCTPSVRKRYNAWSYETFIGSLVRSVFWCELGDITATRKRASTHGDETRHTRGGKDGGRGGKRAHGAGNYIPLWDRTLRNRHELVLTMHFVEARLYPVTCRCVTSFHQLTKLADGEERCDRSSAEHSLEELVVGNFIAISCTPSGATFQEARVHLLLYSSLMIGSHIRASNKLFLFKYSREIWHELTIIKFRNIRDLNL